jgi:homoserine kinase
VSAADLRSVRVRVPATSANLGPGFDCLGLALDLWNETTFTLQGEGLRMTTEGEGRDLPTDERNMVLQAMRFFCDFRGLPFPRGLTIHCRNSIPAGSGLGSSAAAVVTGLLGASALLNSPMEAEEALTLSARMEGHADNAAAAIYGGLVIVAAGKGTWLVRRIPIPPLRAVVVLPSIELPTHLARAALPGDVALKDVTYNLGRALLVVEALREGDLDLLKQSMDDRLHLPFRLPLIPGGQHALDAACEAGASAVTISGAGPSLIAFTEAQPDGTAEAVAEAMVSAFRQHHVTARAFLLRASPTGAAVESLHEPAATG